MILCHLLYMFSSRTLFITYHRITTMIFSFVKKNSGTKARWANRFFTHCENIVKIRFLIPITERQRDQRGRFSREARNSCPNEPGIYVSIEAWRHFDGIICRIQSYTRRFRRILCTIRPLRHRIFSRRI